MLQTAFASRPLVIAHRGASGSAPENTLAAFHLALHHGVRAVELDIRLTADGVPVVIHDATLQRTTGDRRRVSAVSLAQLSQLDAGSWFGRAFAGERIPTLARVLAELHPSCLVNIEIKRVTGKRPKPSIVRMLADVIHDANAAGRILISSFHLPCLREAHRLLPEIPRGVLYHPMLHRLRTPLQIARQVEASAVIFARRHVQQDRVARLHGKGLLVGVYTVDSERALNQVLRFDVDAIISNHPAYIFSLLRGKK